MATKTTAKPKATLKKVETAVKETAAATKEAVKDTVKAAEKKVEKTVKTAEKTVKAAAKKAPAKKEAAKKTVAKTATKAASKAATATKAVAKKAETKVAAKKADLKVSQHVQFSGKSYSTDDLVKIAKDVWKYDMKKKVDDIKSINLYVKPEESQVYFVVNDKEAGSFVIQRGFIANSRGDATGVFVLRNTKELQSFY